MQTAERHPSTIAIQSGDGYPMGAEPMLAYHGCYSPERGCTQSTEHILHVTLPPQCGDAHSIIHVRLLTPRGHEYNFSETEH